jgi:hypothetical protein
MIRVFLFALVAAVALWGVWWMPLVVGFIALLFGSGLEIIFIGIVLDLLYAHPGGFIGLFTGLFALLYIVRAVASKHFFL